MYSTQAWIRVAHRRAVLFFHDTIVDTRSRDAGDRTIETDPRLGEKILGRRQIARLVYRDKEITFGGNYDWYPRILMTMFQRLFFMLYIAAKNFQFFFPSIIRYIKSEERKFNLTKEKSYPCMEMSLL